MEEDKEEEEDKDKDKQELKGASKAKESEITSVSDITTPILEGPKFHGSISTTPVDLSLALMAEGRQYPECWDYTFQMIVYLGIQHTRCCC
jgi:hypothetical protein